MARCARYGADVLHRVHRCRPCLCEARRSASRAKSGVDRAGRRQSCGELLPRFPRGRRNLPDGSKLAGRSAHPGIRAGDRVQRWWQHFCSVATHQPAAAGDASCRCRGHHRPAAQYGGFSLHPGSEAYGIPVGARGLRRRCASRNPPGHPGRGRHLGPYAPLPGQPSLVYIVRRKPGTDVFRPLSAEHPEDETHPGPLDRAGPKAV